jgi:hypothetical protein
MQEDFMNKLLEQPDIHSSRRPKDDVTHDVPPAEIVMCAVQSMR